MIDIPDLNLMKLQSDIKAKQQTNPTGHETSFGQRAISLLSSGDSSIFTLSSSSGKYGQFDDSQKNLDCGKPQVSCFSKNGDRSQSSLPIFISLVTLIQIGTFVYYYVMIVETHKSWSLLAFDSPFIYRPDRRSEVWRLLSYILLHAGWQHLAFNMALQLLAGIPLELSHGSFRVSLVYLSGTLAGSLTTSVLESDICLVGSSGGVYALLAAHASNLIVNYQVLDCSMVRTAFILLVACTDISLGVWRRLYQASDDQLNASYAAHIGGALAGLCVAFVVLKHLDLKQAKWQHWLAYLSLIFFLSMILFAMIWNVFFQRPATSYVSSWA